ncbi:KPN_02809 family neutral zinc metallopeptidase [Anaerococcus vaginalis]|uniref:KPN_02809 family neutral zinc metallopeptidase n=1 Tax=Anaerococcus vaginalis TaxID=33037 RepID=UPI00290FFE47|nr:neutral zinc metallopeptidase [Anaerococcus vaginalis]MDU5374050.1 neutral zinc metallopeptidase [Anaerococcus vaginalis]
MKWKNRRKSSNVNRGSGAPVVFGGGIGGLILVLILYFLGADPSVINNKNVNETQENRYEETISENQKELEDFLSVVLADTEDMWHEKFFEYNLTYKEPSMTLYTKTTKSSCGIAQSGMGPFYCPLDEAIYIDVSFYDELKNTFGAGGDFAFAYVLAHEVGHHVQNELGILNQTQQLQKKLSEKDYNKYSVAQELQADYFAGVYAYFSKEKGYLEKGDIEEAMKAASSIGDDKIQKMSGSNINPDKFTHGSSKDRKNAFDMGYKYHDIEHSMEFYKNLDYEIKINI